MSFFTCAFRVAGALALFLITVTTASAAPGATPGVGDVSATGAATYNVPIRIPAGINGMHPALSIAYHSRAGEGEAGYGWFVDGLSVIARCGKTIAQHGENAGIALDENDRFCLDGNLLRNVQYEYGAHGAYYRLEMDDQSIIRSFLSGAEGSVPSSGPQWFEVEKPNGYIYQYGATSDSRRELVGSDVPIQWALNRITDPFGNRIDFMYSEKSDFGVHYIDAIEYTATPAASAIYTVDFVYEQRPVTDPARSWKYIGGGKFSNFQRLKGVRLLHGGSEFRRYDLEYHQSDASVTGRSLLSSIQECAGTSCLPETTVEWDYPTQAGFDWDRTNRPAITNSVRILDVDGDGRDDVVYPKQGSESHDTWHFLRSTTEIDTTTGFEAEVDTGLRAEWAEYSRVLDYNGDGRGDILYPADEFWKIRISQGDEFVTVSTGVPTGLDWQNTSGRLISTGTATMT